jgi:peptidoglycan/xylan/chitin deacetylase (PgdA/CDA1 family)
VSATQEAWSWLQRELDRWSEDNLRADFWWRDDDASSANPQLERLLRLGKKHSAPLALAVIPSRLDSSLAAKLHNHPGVSVLQHGYSHHSHAAAGERKLELGGSRASADILHDLRQGREILHQHFDSRFSPVLVPPWNRIDQRIVKALPELGFTGISTMRVRRSAWPAAGLRQVNTHLDPINWRHKAGFIGLYPAIAILIQHLVARRSGYRDIDEPTGLLSHHLVQNEPVWRFFDDLLPFLGKHPAINWIDAPSIWKTPSVD